MAADSFAIAITYLFVVCIDLDFYPMHFTLHENNPNKVVFADYPVALKRKKHFCRSAMQ